jgi:hypothetical protein
MGPPSLRRDFDGSSQVHSPSQNPCSSTIQNLFEFQKSNEHSANYTIASERLRPTPAINA